MRSAWCLTTASSTRNMSLHLEIGNRCARRIVSRYFAGSSCTPLYARVSPLRMPDCSRREITEFCSAFGRRRGIRVRCAMARCDGSTGEASSAVCGKNSRIYGTRLEIG